MANPEPAGASVPAGGVPSSRDAALSTPAHSALQGLVAQAPSDDIIDIETISLDGVQIIPADVFSGDDLTADVIVVPPATTADILSPITSELMTYALLQNTTTVAGAPQLTYVSQGDVYIPYTFQRDPCATATNMSPLSAESVMPQLSAVQPEPAESAPSPSEITKKDDAVFLTPLPMITYAKPPNRITKHYSSKPSNPNQNQLIKALLAQKSTPGPYVTRPPAPRPTTSFIIRASTQSSSGKTQILNLPVSVSTPVSIVRNVTQGLPVQPTITHNLLVKEMAQRPSCRSAFVRTSTDFTAQNPSPDTVMTTHATTTTTITTPMTVVPQVSYSISPIIATTGTGAVVATSVSIATAKPSTSTSSKALRMRTTSYPTYTKTYIPVPQFRKPKCNPSAVSATSLPKKSHNLIGSRVLPSCSNTRIASPATITMLGPRVPITTSCSMTASVQRPPGHARTNVIPGYKNKYLEPGEIPQVRKMPPRTFPGPRSVSAAQRQAAAHVEQQAATMAQSKAAKHAKHHAESQATLRALQVHHATSRAVLHATSLAALQAASHAQLEAASQAHLKNTQQQAESQTKDTTLQHPTTQLQLPPTSQTQLQVASLGPLQSVSLAQSQGTLNVQLLTTTQAQLLATSKAQHHGSSQAQVPTTSQAQSQTNSQAQLEHVSQAQHQAVSQAQHQAVSKAQFVAATEAQLITSQAQFQAFSQSQLLIASQAQLQAISRAQLLTTSQAQIQNVSQSQHLTTSHAQHLTTTQAQLQAISQAQLLTTSQAQIQTVALTQPQVTQAKAHTQHQSDSHAQVKPSLHTHHRLIIRSAPPSAPVAERIITTPATSHSIADEAAAVTKPQNEQLPNTSLQGSADGVSSSIHTTSTLTLATGTTLIMPHYKTTVFKNLSTIARAEPSRFATPTTSAGAAERVVIRRPVAYFSARRSFPTQPPGSGTPVNVQRHIIRTIPRHVLGTHLQSSVVQALPGPRMPQVVSTSSSELPAFTMLSQNTPQSADKKETQI